jgi:hypothetical protein
MLRGCVLVWAVHPPTSAKISTMKERCLPTQGMPNCLADSQHFSEVSTWSGGVGEFQDFL